jgi:hypothetical protein
MRRPAYNETKGRGDQSIKGDKRTKNQIGRKQKDYRRPEFNETKRRGDHQSSKRHKIKETECKETRGAKAIVQEDTKKNKETLERGDQKTSSQD